MAVPIANDWKAIHDRMQQIQAERSPPFGRCLRCNNLGWIPEPLDDRRRREARVVPCYLVRKPDGSAPAAVRPQKMRRRGGPILGNALGNRARIH
jgi:hypothetical protein